MATEAQGKVDLVEDAPPPPQRGKEFITSWWEDTSAEDVEEVLAKLDLYGNLDFHARCMLALVGRPYASLREGTELAIASYIAGKLNRLFEGLSHGVLPEADSWDDLSRYAMMARYVRKFGRWP